MEFEWANTPLREQTNGPPAPNSVAAKNRVPNPYQYGKLSSEISEAVSAAVFESINKSRMS